MSGIAVKLPFARSSEDGFATTKTIEETIKQNFKSLLLTRPGERIMDPDFGVGMDTFLFENFNDGTFSSINKRIVDQVNVYMPQITIERIDFNSSEQDQNQLNITIRYRIDPLGTTDILDFPVSAGLAAMANDPIDSSTSIGSVITAGGVVATPY